MRVILKNIIQKNIENLNQSVLIKKKVSPNDTINITPFFDYINNSTHSRTRKRNLTNTIPRRVYDLYDNSSSINQTYFDIGNLTINNKTNLTNLNLYFLNNSENPNSNIIRKKNVNNVLHSQEREKEPRDSIRKKLYFIKKPLDTDYSRENMFKRNSPIKKAITETLVNNTKALFNRNKENKENKENITKIINKIKEKNKNKENKDMNRGQRKIIESRGHFNLSEFTLINQIGKGTFGKIFSVKWNKNGKNYAIKKEVFNDLEYVKTRQNIVNIINEFLIKTKNKGVIEIYSTLCEKGKDDKYYYYELMEIGEKDLGIEINERRNRNLYYTEKELFNMAYQLITTLALLQKNHITHRDIKPQNILIVNGHLKLCDFGEIRIMKKGGLVVQRIRGSELYMSPILFYGLRQNLKQVRHNTYKSDVFSLGMCLLYAATMYFNCTDEIREMTDMNEIKSLLKKYLEDKYSNKFISLIHLMLQVEEQLRPDFIHLEEKLNNILII